MVLKEAHGNLSEILPRGALWGCAMISSKKTMKPWSQGMMSKYNPKKLFTSCTYFNTCVTITGVKKVTVYLVTKHHTCICYSHPSDSITLIYSWLMEKVAGMPPGCEYQNSSMGCICIKMEWITWISRSFMDKQLLPCFDHLRSDDNMLAKKHVGNQGNKELVLAS